MGQRNVRYSHGIRIDPAGDVWTLDAHTSMVFKFTPEGKKLLEISVGDIPDRTQVLRGHGHRVRRNGARLIADGYCNARVIAILLDMMMPLTDGAQTIAALRMQRETAAAPVIFLTAKTIVAEIQGMKDLGAAGILANPFDPRKLAADALALLR